MSNIGGGTRNSDRATGESSIGRAFRAARQRLGQVVSPQPTTIERMADITGYSAEENMLVIRRLTNEQLNRPVLGYPEISADDRIILGEYDINRMLHDINCHEYETMRLHIGYHCHPKTPIEDLRKLERETPILHDLREPYESRKLILEILPDNHPYRDHIQKDIRRYELGYIPLLERMAEREDVGLTPRRIPMSGSHAHNMPVARPPAMRGGGSNRPLVVRASPPPAQRNPARRPMGTPAQRITASRPATTPAQLRTARRDAVQDAQLLWRQFREDPMIYRGPDAIDEENVRRLADITQGRLTGDDGPFVAALRMENRHLLSDDT